MGKVIALVHAGKNRVMAPFIPDRHFRPGIEALVARQVLIMGLGGWQALGCKKVDGAHNIVLTTHVDEFFKAYPDTQDLNGLLVGESFGDAYSFMQRAGNTRNIWVLPGPTLFAKAYAYFDRVFVAPLAHDIEGEYYLPNFELDFEEYADERHPNLKTWARKSGSATEPLVAPTK